MKNIGKGLIILVSGGEIAAQTAMLRRPVGRFLKLCRVLRVRGLSLRSKILLNHIAVLMVPVIVIFLFVYNDYVNDKKDAALKLIRQVNGQAVGSLDAYLLDLDELTKQPLYDSSSSITSIVSRDPDILQILRDADRPQESAVTGENPGDAFLPNGPDNGRSLGNSIAEMSTVRRVLHRILTLKKSIHSVFMFSRDGGRYDCIMPDNALVDPYDPSGEEWFERTLEADGSAVVNGCLTFRGLAHRKNDSQYFFSVSRAIKDTGSTELLGVISIYTSVEFLKDLCAAILTVPDERILLLDENGRIVYDTVETNILKSVDDPSFDLRDAEFAAVGAGGAVASDGKKYLVESTASEVSRWRLVRLLPEESIYRSVKDIQNKFLLLLLAFVVLSVFLSAAISLNVTRPLARLINTMKVAGKGDLSVRFKVVKRDEVGRLGLNFNEMMNRIDNLVNTVYESRLRKKEAELAALQTQINPHFIYNTLESVRMTAELNDDVAASKMILLLGKLLRYNIGMKNRIVTVGQELEHLSNYILLQEYRFSDKFEVRIDVPRDLYDVPVIKLIFQPIVENAVFHGLETLDGKGIIRVSGRHADGCLVFEIRDNGVGMSEEQLEELTRSAGDFSSGRPDTKGIGLRNVNERIKLYYGEEFGLSISSEPLKGTLVTIRLPEKSDVLQA